ncbi:MAG TPA: tetratricopeptide repeat protein [Pseudomonadales bacterium]|nr:tetratricopeptide repeat protein [Pseudomonadales bacterium]
MQELIDASFDFVALFPADKRSPATQVNGARMLFETGRFQQAAEAAEHALSQWDLTELWTTSALISAHSRFELGHYSRAEQTYRSLLAKAKSDKDGSAAEITQRLLATVYKQAEAAELANDLDAAIDHLLALQEIDASSELAINAAYDTVALFEQVGKIDQAINHLKAFRRNHPLHPATRGIAMRLVALYERENRFEDSANELIGVHASTDFPADVQQQALYRAGELYLSVENYPMAIDSFRIYAHSYERPFGLRMEAMHHMDLLYQQTNQTQARYFWLGRKVDAYAKADVADQDERTRFLAVQASFIIAESRLADFLHLDLKQPLKKSLQKKRKAMKLAVDAFEQTSDFGVAGFVEGSTFHIADIYQSLAQSLMESDRPNGLNALESDQYDILLEEQAFPFEEQAIDIHMVNLHRGWNDAWNHWVGQSLTALETLSPGRYRREEIGVPYVEKLY